MGWLPPWARERWESIAEYSAMMWRWIPIITLGPVFGASGIIDLVLNAFGVSRVVPRPVWLIVLIGILVVSPFTVFHRTRLQRDGYRKKVRELTDIHPDICFQMQISDEWLFLKVTNRGPEAAVFSARVLRIMGMEVGQIGKLGYDLGWYGTPGEPKDKELAKGESGLLTVARSGGVAGGAGGEQEAEVEFREVGGSWSGRGGHIRLGGEFTCTIEVYAKPSLVSPVKRTLILALSREKDGPPKWRGPISVQ